MTDESILSALRMAEESTAVPTVYVPDEGFTFKMSQRVTLSPVPRTASFHGFCNVCHAEMHQEWIGDPPYKWRCDCGIWYKFDPYGQLA